MQKVFTINCKQGFKTKKEMKRKNFNLLKKIFCLYKVSTTFLFSLNFLPQSKVFIIINNLGIFRLPSQCISISLIVKKGILYCNCSSFFSMLRSIFSSILFTRTSSISLVFLLVNSHQIWIS